MMEKYKRPFRLEELKIEVTHQCPLICVHCSSDATPSCKREITFEKCLDIIQQAIAMGTEKIAFSGGEPLVWASIVKAVQTASEGGLKVTVYTSGNVSGIEELLRKLKDYGLNKLIFSIYSPKWQEHERITRIAGSFNRTISAISDASRLGIETELHFVAMSKNYQRLKQVAELGKEIGVTRISVLRLVPQGRGALLSNGVLNKLQNIELKRTITELRNQGYDIRTGSPFNFLMVNDKPECMSAINRLIIDPELRLYPCDAFKNITAEEIVGTLNLSTLETSTLGDCWQNSPYLETIRDHITSDYKEPCKSCACVDKCLSGCLAQKVIEYGGLRKDKDPSCIMI